MGGLGLRRRALRWHRGRGYEKSVMGMMGRPLTVAPAGAGRAGL
jgi:hypothetical protein